MNLEKNGTSMNRSTLQKLIIEALQVYPEDAHLNLLNFLKSKGIKEEEIQNFRRAWSKVVVANESFGRKNLKTGIEPVMFSEEIINELATNYSETQQLKKAQQTTKDISDKLSKITIDSSNYTQYEKDIKFAWDSINDIGKYYETLNATLFPFPSDKLLFTTEEKDANEMNISIFQESIENVRFEWVKTVSKDNARFEPMFLDPIFDFAYRFGKVTKPSKTPQKRQFIPLYFASDDIIGMEVFADFSSAQDQAWKTYGFLWDFLATQSFNLFPKPIEAEYSTEQLSTIYVFECPVGESITKYLGNVLFTRLIRSFPHVLIAWCSQLALALLTLVSNTEAILFRTMNIWEDILITEDGLLLWKRVAFEELSTMHLLEPSNHKPSSHHQYLKHETTLPTSMNVIHRHNLRQFLPGVHTLLTSALCLSRTITMTLHEVYAFTRKGSVFACYDPSTLGFGVSNKGGQSSGGREGNEDDGEVPGHLLLSDQTLQLEVYDRHIRDCVVHTYDEIYGNNNNSGEDDSYDDNEKEEVVFRPDDQYNRLIVIYHFYPDTTNTTTSTSSKISTITSTPEISFTIQSYIPAISSNNNSSGSASSDTSSKLVLSVRCTQPGTLLFECFFMHPNFLDLSQSRRSYGTVAVKILAQQSIPTSPSLALQEVIHHLEEYALSVSSASPSPYILLHSYLFTSAKELLVNTEEAKNLLMQCTKDWAQIRGELNKAGFR